MSANKKKQNDKNDSSHVLVADEQLDFSKVDITDATPSCRHVLSAQTLSPHGDYSVIQWLADGTMEELHLEDPVKVESGAVPKLLIFRSDRLFRFVLNDRAKIWPADEISEQVLRTLAFIPDNHVICCEREETPDATLSPGEITKLEGNGTEAFRSRPGKWKLNVQGVVIEHDAPTIIARDAIMKAGLDADASWIIVLKTSADRKQIGIEDLIDLTLPGIEKLRLTPKEINNGEVVEACQQAFDLLPADVAGLEARGIEWCAVVDAGRRWLLLCDFALPDGYQSETATIAVEVPTTYNAAELDMFYCNPSLSLTSGQAIPQTQVQQEIQGATYQRWSRHRGPTSRWRPGVDNVLSHLALIEECLLREVQ